MPWTAINNFLDRFKNFKPPREFIQSSAVQVILDIIGVSIDSKNLEFRNGNLYIKISNPAMKNQIFCYKQKILNGFAEKMGPKAPKDIIFKGE